MPATQAPRTTMRATSTSRAMIRTFMAGWIELEKQRTRVCRGNQVARDGTSYNAVDCFQRAKQLGGRQPPLMRFRRIPTLLVSLGIAAAAPVRAQEPLNPPV